MPITEKDLENLLPIADFPDYSRFDSRAISDRDAFIEEFGIFGLPCKEFLEWVVAEAGTKTVYDIGSGTGYLSYGLTKLNPDLNVIAVDHYKSRFHGKHLNEYRIWYSAIESVAFSTIKNSIVIINWCDYGSDLAYKIAKYLHKSNRMIYIGESEGGCTAEDKFFKKFELTELDVPWFHWKYMHDRPFEVKLKGHIT